jgi:hypothetical protein
MEIFRTRLHNLAIYNFNIKMADFARNFPDNFPIPVHVIIIALSSAYIRRMHVAFVTKYLLFPSKI